MMKTKNNRFLPCLMFAIVLFSGCAAFRSDINGKFETPAEKNYRAEKVSVLFIFSHVRQTIGYDAIPKLENSRQIIRGFDDIFQDALQEISNIKNFATFTEYAADITQPERRAEKDSLIASHDYVMNIKFRKEKSFAKQFLGTLVSTVSVTLFPVPYKESYAVTLDVYDAEGLLVKNYARDTSLSKWVQSCMIFVYPFHNERRKQEEIYVEFLHDIFRQIETEKMLAVR